MVGHDCGHRSFSKNKLLEDIVGTIMFAPLVYPFEPWRIKHNHHHAHTNKYADQLICRTLRSCNSVLKLRAMMIVKRRYTERRQPYLRIHSFTNNN